MRGLTPSGPEADEGRISLVDQNQPQQQDAARHIQPEEVLEEGDHRPAAEEQTSVFSYSCAAGCGAVTRYAQKPTRLNSGQWPTVRCVACGKLVRIGLGQCQFCGRKLNACKCGEVRGPGTNSDLPLRQRIVRASCFVLVPVSQPRGGSGPDNSETRHRAISSDSQIQTCALRERVLFLVLEVAAMVTT